MCLRDGGVARPHLRALRSRAASWRSVRPYVRRGGCIPVRQAQNEPARLSRDEPSPPLPITSIFCPSPLPLPSTTQRLHLTPLQVQRVVPLYGQSKTTLVKQRRRTIQWTRSLCIRAAIGHSSNVTNANTEVGYSDDSPTNWLTD